MRHIFAIFLKNYSCKLSLLYLDIDGRWRFRENQITGVEFFVHLNNSYKDEFGDIFYKEWLSNSKGDRYLSRILEIAFIFNDQQNIASLVSSSYRTRIDYETQRIGGVLRLSRFYKTLLFEANQHFYQFMTEKEKTFMKGIGHYVLKYVLKELISTYIKLDEYLVIEASGGKNETDMKSLDLYYRSIGFSPASYDDAYISYAYKEMHLLMYAKIKDILSVNNSINNLTHSNKQSICS